MNDTARGHMWGAARNEQGEPYRSGVGGRAKQVIAIGFGPFSHLLEPVSVFI